MRFIERTMNMTEKRKGAQGTEGVYGIADDTGAVRYVGSSNCIEYRAYAHLHTGARAKGLGMKAAWLRQMREEGRAVQFVVLEECAVGKQGSTTRHERERYWIDRVKADLNVQLTPVGHATSQDSIPKKQLAELVALRERVKELTAERDALKERLATFECFA